jgi:hypothetical protein
VAAVAENNSSRAFLEVTARHPCGNFRAISIFQRSVSLPPWLGPLEAESPARNISDGLLSPYKSSDLPRQFMTPYKARAFSLQIKSEAKL